MNISFTELMEIMLLVVCGAICAIGYAEYRCDNKFGAVYFMLWAIFILLLSFK